MSLVLTVPDEIAEAANEMAERCGETPEHWLLSALKVHFPPIPEELQAEFDALERASDEDILRFEANLEAEQNAAR